MRSNSPLPAVAGSALVVALAGIAFWSFAHPDPAPQPVETTPGSAALRAYIDTETGELTQGHAAARPDLELEQALSRSTEGLVEVHRPDGSVHVNLEGRFQSASVARLNRDGTVETTCVETPVQAEAFLDGAATPTVEVDR